MSITKDSDGEVQITSIQNISDEINELAADGNDFYVEVESDGFSLKGLIFKGMYLAQGEWLFDEIDHLKWPLEFTIQNNAIINSTRNIGRYIFNIKTMHEEIRIHMN